MSGSNGKAVRGHGSKSPENEVSVSLRTEANNGEYTGVSEEVKQDFSDASSTAEPNVASENCACENSQIFSGDNIDPTPSKCNICSIKLENGSSVAVLMDGTGSVLFSQCEKENSARQDSLHGNGSADICHCSNSDETENSKRENDMCPRCLCKKAIISERNNQTATELLIPDFNASSVASIEKSGASTTSKTSLEMAVEAVTFYKQEYGEDSDESIVMITPPHEHKGGLVSMGSPIGIDIEVIESPPKDAHKVTVGDHSPNGNGFAFLDFDYNVNEKSVQEIINRIKFHHYTAIDKSVARIGGEDDIQVYTAKTDADIYSICKSLYEKDYVCEVLNNEGGVFCQNYPDRILVPLEVKVGEGLLQIESNVLFDPKLYWAAVKEAPTARCRKRFPVPVMMYKGKYICRSGTLVVLKTKMYETATQPQEPKAQKLHEDVSSFMVDKFKNTFDTMTQYINTAAEVVVMAANPDQTMECTFVKDAKVLESLNIGYICDLMVEKRKIHTGISVSSSEKIHPEEYKRFKILQMPYPGCEFFAKYHEAERNPEGLVHDWSSPDVDIEFMLPEVEPIVGGINWDDYKDWDVVQLTQNYIKLLLRYLNEGDKGLLIHCISGWDRTPVFVSLLRLSLWADGKVHSNLSVLEMAYLTLGYDWYLFGHDAPTRIRKKEEILHFCFKFLPYIASDEYSSRLYDNSSDLPANRVPSVGRGEKLRSLSTLVLRLYEKMHSVT